MRFPIVVLALMFPAAAAEGTSPCVKVGPSESFHQAKVVVLGEVVSSTPTDYRGKPAAANVAVRARYRVHAIEEFKGKGLREYWLLADPPVIAGDAASVTNSGMPVALGQSYLFFASGELLAVDPCASLPASQADEALRRLRLLSKKVTH